MSKDMPQAVPDHLRARLMVEGVSNPTILLERAHKDKHARLSTPSPVCAD